MDKENLSIEDKEQLFIISMKNEIEGMVDVKLHSQYKKGEGKIDHKKIEEECRTQFFDGLSHTFEHSINTTREFYNHLRIDDPVLFSKLQGELEPLSAKLAGCKTVRDLLEVGHYHLSKEDEEKVYALGLQYFKNEHYDVAYLYFVYLTLFNAQNAQWWLSKGMAEQNLGRYQEALTSYVSAMTLAPGNLVVYIQIMNALLLLKRFDEAHRVYETFMREVEPEQYIHNAFMTSQLSLIRSFLAHPVS